MNPMNPITPVVAFVWGEESAARTLDAWFERKPGRGREPQFAAFIAARGPQAGGDSVRNSRR